MRFIRMGMVLMLGSALCGCARIESVPLAGGGTESGPVFEREGKFVRHGVWTSTHPDGTRRSRVRHVRGVRTGLCQEWHTNGVLAAQVRLGWDGNPLPGEPEKRWNPDGTAVTPPEPNPPAGKTEEKTRG